MVYPMPPPIWRPATVGLDVVIEAGEHITFVDDAGDVVGEWHDAEGTEADRIGSTDGVQAGPAVAIGELGAQGAEVVANPEVTGKASAQIKLGGVVVSEVVKQWGKERRNQGAVAVDGLITGGLGAGTDGEIPASSGIGLFHHRQGVGLGDEAGVLWGDLLSHTHCWGVLGRHRRADSSAWAKVSEGRKTWGRFHRDYIRHRLGTFTQGPDIRHGGTTEKQATGCGDAHSTEKSSLVSACEVSHGVCSSH